MTDKICNVLFLCTGNSARSVMAEAILNRLGEGRVAAYSAGSDPKGKVNPFALELLESLDHPVASLRSKSWDEFSGQDAIQLDFVITLCDSAANEVCPVWWGAPLTAHWGLPDPAAADGDDTVKRTAFAESYRLLCERIERFLRLPISSLDEVSLKQALDEIGDMPIVGAKESG